MAIPSWSHYDVWMQAGQWENRRFVTAGGGADLHHVVDFQTFFFSPIGIHSNETIPCDRGDAVANLLQDRKQSPLAVAQPRVHMRNQNRATLGWGHQLESSGDASHRTHRLRIKLSAKTSTQHGVK